MDKQNPVNTYHACTLLHQYCQLYVSKYQPIDLLIDHDQQPHSEEADVGGGLQGLNIILQKKERFNVSELSMLTIQMLNRPENQRYIHTLEAHCYVYDILDIVTYIDQHVYDEPAEFWVNKNDVNMRQYNLPVCVNCSRTKVRGCTPCVTG
jgi:hypothetical protein